MSSHTTADISDRACGQKPLKQSRDESSRGEVVADPPTAPVSPSGENADTPATTGTPRAPEHDTSAIVAAPQGAADVASAFASLLRPHGVLRDAGEWPTAHTPPAIPAAGAPAGPALEFIHTAAGPWCFEPRIKERMVRMGEYPQLWARVKDVLARSTEESRERGLLILGHPGIGKTLLLDVLLSWLLHDFPQQPVVVMAPHFLSFFVNVPQHGGKKRFHARGKPQTFPLELVADTLRRAGVPPGSQVVVLHDIKSDFGFQYAILNTIADTFAVTCIVASSPPSPKYKEYKKWAQPPYQHMLPVLSAEEAKLFAVKCDPHLTDAKFDEYFDAVGGVCRHLRSQDNVAVATNNIECAARGVRYGPGFGAGGHAMHVDPDTVVSMVPSDDRKGRIEAYDFVSRLARRSWLQRVVADGTSPQLQLLRGDNDGICDVRGRLFEEWFLVAKLQRRGGPDRDLFRQQLSPRGVLAPWLTDVQATLAVKRFPGNTAARVTRVPKKKPTLFVPLVPDFPMVSAVLVVGARATLIRVAFADPHEVAAGPTAQLIETLKRKGLKVDSFVWVVDPSSKLDAAHTVATQPRNLLGAADANDAAKQTLDKVPQYVCRVGEFMCWVREVGDGAAPAVAVPVSSTDPEQSEIEAAIRTCVLPAPSDTAIAVIGYTRGNRGWARSPLRYALLQPQQGDGDREDQ